MRLVRRQSGGGICPPQKAFKKSSSLFQPGVQLVVRKAPLFPGLSVTSFSSNSKKFQRPFCKRRTHAADHALKTSSLGPRKRFNGMAKLLARAGRGLSYQLPKVHQPNDGLTDESDSDQEEEEKEDEKPFEPLLVWTSPHSSVDTETGTDEAPTSHSNYGLPPTLVQKLRPNEYGIDEEVTVVQPAPLQAYSKRDVYVPPVLAKWLRPHQREGVQFLYECVMGLKGFAGSGCILADDMGLGKTLQSVTLIYTLLKTGITARGEPTAKRVIVICPCSLVKNWANEFVKWLGPGGGVKVLALAEGDRKSVERDLDSFAKTRIHNILVASYECIRTHVGRLTKYPDCCDLLVCDEAHRLKNSENQTSRALNSLPVKRRVLLTGTPMQNDLGEFYAMVDFTNPGILGTIDEFTKYTKNPILRGREPDATEAQQEKMRHVQEKMAGICGDFILRRINTLNAQHLPPKLVQVVCCNLTDIQKNMYQHLVDSKDAQHVLDGKQVNCLASIQMLMKLANHPSLVVEDESSSSSMKGGRASSGRRASAKQIKYNDEDTPETTAAPGADGIAKFLPYSNHGGGRGSFGPVHPEWSGKMFVLWRLMKEMRRPGNGNDKIVIISNYTQTLDLIGKMCRENSWGFCRLDGGVTMKKRQKMVDEFNDPCSSLVAFLLSSKAGGCGINLIGGNRLVLFDPDWNPAVDKQAAARCWRDGQKKRCFTYRFLATGTVEEKIFQRQLSKEGLQSVVDDKEQVNTLSTKDLRNLFKLRHGTPSDTHDKLRCERCKIIQDNAELEAVRVLPKKIAACRVLFEELCQQEDAAPFQTVLDPTLHGKTKEEYEKYVKQPMDLAAIRKRLDQPQDQPSSYKNVSDFAKDVNRIFSNIVKVWEPGDEIADTSRRLQAWWVEKWTELVPVLMRMKADSDEDNENKGDNSDSAEDVLEACASGHNERGEDYQEQIGMPDEEDMRKWSHHHNTDTVDDPIFRAAMRGCDAVSFVFGLEVTWSLIQERQQAEEAAMELECIKEAQEEGEDFDEEQLAPTVSEDPEDGNSSSDDDGEKSAPVESNETNDSEEVSDSSDEDDEAPLELEDDEESKEDAIMDSDDDGEEEADVDEEKEGEDNSGDEDDDASKASTPCAQAEVLPSQASNGADVVELLGSSQSSNDSSDSQPSAKEWACPACTLHNKKALRKCSACGTKKPPVGKKRSFDALGA